MKHPNQHEEEIIYECAHPNSPNSEFESEGLSISQDPKALSNVEINDHDVDLNKSTKDNQDEEEIFNEKESFACISTLVEKHRCKIIFPNDNNVYDFHKICGKEIINTSNNSIVKECVQLEANKKVAVKTINIPTNKYQSKENREDIIKNCYVK